MEADGGDGLIWLGLACVAVLLWRQMHDIALFCGSVDVVVQSASHATRVSAFSVDRWRLLYYHSSCNWRFVSRCNVSIVGTMWIAEKAEFCD